MKFKSILIALISLSFVAVACDKPNEEAAADEPAAEAKEQAEAPEAEKADEGQEKEEAESEELAMVDVPKEGKAFDPEVEKEQIPAGAWFCDMGTVHYARMDKGDGTCPECNMKLKQQSGEAKKAAADEAADDPHAGHNH